MAGGVTTNASGFSRKNTNGHWDKAWLGAYAQGLGVTDIGENGSNNTHVVDNIGGYHDYVLLEFSAPIVVDQLFLDYIFNGHSNISVWIGTKTNPIANHNMLSDAFLASLGMREDNNTTSTASSRWADINAANKVGNVIVVAASTSDTTLNDAFKLHKVLFCGGTPGPTPTPTPTPTPGCPTITVNPSTLPNGNVGVAYSQTLTASGGSSPYTFAKISGNLPTGLTLSSGGVLSGTPTAAGSFTFTIDAKDSHGCDGTRQYTVTIAGCPTITVSPSTVPNGTVGAPYSQTFTASGGSSPYTFRTVTGNLPTGLTLSVGGVLSGTPTTAGSFTFTIGGKDSNGCEGTRQYTVTITPPACPPTQICVSPVSVTFTAIAGGANPASQSIQVTTSNGATWHSLDTSPWFDAGPITGASGTSTTLVPHINGLGAGTYTENITFSASGLPNKVVVVTLILN